jgi:hypothetical protein
VAESADISGFGWLEKSHLMKISGIKSILTKNNIMENRSKELDALRSFAILYIVAFWHLYAIYNRFTSLFTYCVLGLFIYISGYVTVRRTHLGTCFKMG